jgi:hypothetical protein
VKQGGGSSVFYFYLYLCLFFCLVLAQVLMDMLGRNNVKWRFTNGTCWLSAWEEIGMGGNGLDWD